jgi:hypothetical protein
MVTRREFLSTAAELLSRLFLFLAAKRGWETRRAHDAGYVGLADNPSIDVIEAIRMQATATAPVASPNPAPGLAAMLRRWWLRATGWMR